MAHKKVTKTEVTEAAAAETTSTVTLEAPQDYVVAEAEAAEECSSPIPVETAPAADKKTSPETEEDNDDNRLPPYALNYNRLKALFDGDPELTISPLDVKGRSVTISSHNYYKILALSKILRSPMEGLKIKLVSETFDSEYARTLEDALKGNPHFESMRVATEAQTGNKILITTFKDETIQYDADNRFVPHGYETTLAETLVKQLFRREYRRSVFVTKEKDHDYPFFNKLFLGEGIKINSK